MGNIVKSINLDLILEGTGVTPTIPANPRAVFGDPDFDQTSDLMIGQKAYNVTDDIWYYRGKNGIYEIPTNKTYVIDAYQYVEIGGLMIDKPGDYVIWQSQFPEGRNINILINLANGGKASVMCKASLVGGIMSTDGEEFIAQPGYTYNFIAVKKSLYPYSIGTYFPMAIEYITIAQGMMQIPSSVGGGEQ